MKKTFTKVKKFFKKITIGGWILILSLTIVISFGAVFVWFIYDASLSTGTIISGNRFKFELEPKIEAAKLEELRTALDNADYSVESSINQRSGSLRVTVLVRSDMTDVELQTAIIAIKDLINTSLPIETYFTSTADVKMYDLEIHVYNSKEPVSTETFKYHYFILVKNSVMKSWSIQEVSVPVNPELAALLRAQLNPTDDETDATPTE
ncbi:MAG: hypothetical protein FD133_1517 [Erysipelotrichaceae bacterium]|nr:MAG: hypothetical protein FD179_1523 [Erysipelotrichaceae bacterium]TXT17160.1 MAG: hypothetical protein FD133_1517 [Erysipelotrichaceae bacterium]